MVTSLRALVFALLFILAGCSGCSGSLTEPATQFKAPPPDPVMLTMESTGVLLRKRVDGTWRGGICAIEYIAPTRLITARHCVFGSAYSNSEYDSETATEEPNPIGREMRWVTFGSVTETKGVKGPQTVGVVVALDDENDLALVSLKSDQEPSSSWLEVSSGAPELGDPVLTVGHPLGLIYSLSLGNVSYPEREAYGSTYIQVNIGVYYGNSGGALVDANGKLVGICSAFADMPHLALFIHPTKIRDLMASVGW